MPVYRWAGPPIPPAATGCSTPCSPGSIDVLAFTSAPAAASLLSHGRAGGRLDELLAALRAPVLVVCVGPVTAAPLEAPRRAGGPAGAVPARRDGAGAGGRAARAGAPAAGSRDTGCELRGHAVLVDGVLRPVSPAPMALLRVLAGRPGGCCPGRADLLLAALPGDPRGSTSTPWRSAIARLRTALGAAGLVQTVVKRGYRLAVDPVGVAS